MKRRPFPDPLYVVDDESAFLRSIVRRRLVTAFEWFYFFASGLGVILFLFVLLIIGVIVGMPNWLWISLSIVVMLGGSWAVSHIALLRRVPLRCSRCSRLMERHSHDYSGGGNAVFYICTRCKKYVDSEVSYGD